jgi:hypothetical protein
MNLEIGSVIGDYEVIGILGAGGMGKVYKVRNTISDRIEAMKVLLPDLASDPDLADRFLREIKVQASLEHPNIASLHTAVRVDNQLLMLMECVEGVTLEQQANAGLIPTAQAVDYIRQVLDALDYAHGRGVIHRDIKPANMMLTPGGVVKLMDFGIAKGATDRRLTMTGTTMGSLYYMSPEQIQGTAGLDARADLYSLGVSLYELVTGKRPFDGDSQFAIMSAHLEKNPVPPIEIDPKLPSLLNDVILMSVLKDPNARFQTARAFRNALGNVTAMPTVTMAPPAAVPAPVPSGPAKSKRGLWMGLGAVAAVLALVAVFELIPSKGAKAGIEAGAIPVTKQQPVVEPPQPQAQTTPTTAPITTPSEPVAAVPSPQQQQATPLIDAKPAKTAARPIQQGQVASPPLPQQQVQQQPLPQQPVQQQQAAQQPPTAPITQQPAAAQPAENAAVRAQLNDIRQDLGMLNVRANGIRKSLQGLEERQAAKGLGLGAQYKGPRDLMANFLDEAANALNAGDVATAKDMLKKAEYQAGALEKLLNHY